MGLAASQCRFLMLTSRESDVESKLMTLSNQQMALSQKATRLSTEFAKAMSAQSVSFNDTPVSYSDIMKPNLVEDVNGNVSQYIFKTCRGNVVLSSGIAANIKSCCDVTLDGMGSAKDFKKMLPSRSDFISKMIGANPEDADVVDASGAARSEIQKSAYKYNDNIMNQAIVNVQSASIMALSGYGFESMEYAMGTQEDKLSAYACIWTLDESQYSQPNVHSIVNMFVDDATTKMAEQLMAPDNLGNSSAVIYATNYAIEKTRALYADETKVGIQSTGRNVTNEIDTLAGLKQTTSSKTILVADLDTHKTVTTDVDPSGNPTLDITHLTGKDIFIDTAQLTAVFLNYFDAGMLYAMRDAVSAGSLIPEETSDYQYIQSLSSKAAAIEAFNGKNTNSLDKRMTALSAGTDGVGGFNKDMHDYVKKTDANGNEVIDSTTGNAELEDKGLSIKAENGTMGWFGNTAVANDEKTKTGTSTLVAQSNFYGYLYDAMAEGGWVYNINVSQNDEYLDTQLQHGNMYLCEYSSNYKTGHTLSVDDASSGLSLVDNATKIDKAQADYEAETAKIDYKTNIIETQMQTLQTELDSIQSEKESVKSVIDKHLEKRFNIFS